VEFVVNYLMLEAGSKRPAKKGLNIMTEQNLVDISGNFAAHPTPCTATIRTFSYASRFASKVIHHFLLVRSHALPRGNVRTGELEHEQCNGSQG
jgi:hypothetical protein